MVQVQIVLSSEEWSGLPYVIAKSVARQMNTVQVDCVEPDGSKVSSVESMLISLITRALKEIK